MRADIHDGPEQHSSKQRPDTLMQDRISQVEETPCTARPDHTSGSDSVLRQYRPNDRFGPPKRTWPDHLLMSQKCQLRTRAVQQIWDAYSITSSARAKESRRDFEAERLGGGQIDDGRQQTSFGHQKSHLQINLLMPVRSRIRATAGTMRSSPRYLVAIAICLWCTRK